MADSKKKTTWLTAISAAAVEQGITLPPFVPTGMGTARSEINGERFVTFKRRLISGSVAEREGVEWTLWTNRDEPRVVLAFREPLQADRARVTAVLRILKGWLLDNWSIADAESAVASAA